MKLKINQGLPDDVQRRFDELVAKRQDETLTPDEHQELLHLIDQIEKSDVKRMQYHPRGHLRLAELTRLRGISLTTLMDQLGIHPPDYA